MKYTEKQESGALSLEKIITFGQNFSACYYTIPVKPLFSCARVLWFFCCENVMQCMQRCVCFLFLHSFNRRKSKIIFFIFFFIVFSIITSLDAGERLPLAREMNSANLSSEKFHYFVFVLFYFHNINCLKLFIVFFY